MDFAISRGASFMELLNNLDSENLITTFLYVILQRNVMFHSLRRAVLSGVVEAISCVNSSSPFYIILLNI